MPNAFTWITTSPSFGPGSGISLMTRLSRPPNFSRTIARIRSLPGGDYLKGSAVVAAFGFSLRTREKIADHCRDFIAVRFKRKVTGVEEPHLRTWNVAPEGLRARRQEEGVVFAPNGQERWPVFAEVLLKNRVKRDVALVVAKQVQLDFIGAAPGQIEVVE